MSVPLSVYYTQNGGTTWQLSTTQLNGDIGLAAGAPVSVQFVDSQHGFIAAQLGTGASTSAGLLFRTADGGVTWTSSSLPAFGGIAFQSTSTGWLAGGVLGDQLWLTGNGGATWSQVSYPTPSPPISGGNTYYAIQPPVFSTPSDGVLPVTGAFLDEAKSYIPPGGSADDSALRFDVTHDGGQTWSVATSYSTSNYAPGPGVSLPASIVDQNDWISAVSGGGTTTVTTNQGSSSTNYSSSGLPLGPLNGGGSLSTMQFITLQSGWATVQGGYCNSSKSDCHSFANLYSSSDGGATWAQLTPP
jgi:photosystem II stability/assembly factor-like uncharacterized protein